MKKIVLKLYEFDELSKDSQERIIEREHWNVMEQCMDAYGIDYKKSMKAFEDMTDTRVYNWEVGYERYDFSYEFKYKDPIYEHPTDYHRDIFPENLCGKLLFRYINNNIMPYIIKGKYFSTSGKYIDGKYKYRHKYSRVMFDYGDNCPLTGMCYDYYLLKPIIDYYNAWCTYPEDFSLEDLMRQCYDNFFKSWHEEYEYWADNEDAIREELVSSCGLTEDECRKLQEESESFNDEMIKFIDNMFGRENMISEGSTISENDTICINIKYHKIGEVFNYKVGMSEMTLRVDKCDRCSGCAFENYIYDCVKSGCLGCEREDGESVRYTIVNT